MESGGSLSGDVKIKIKKIIESLESELVDEWLIWRPIMERVATLYEIETVYSLDDIVRVNTYLDVLKEVESASIPKGK